MRPKIIKADKKKKVNYMKIFKTVLDMFEGRKPKDKNFYDRIYVIFGLISQFEELKDFQFYIKTDTKLSYEKEMVEIERLKKNEDGEEIVVKKLVPYYKNVVLKFTDGTGSVPMIKNIYKKEFLEEVIDYE